MSIATLKRKTQTQYHNMSVGLHGFSLNGTLRSQGYVGQTSLSRSLPRTLMRGTAARGHGGCCGQFVRNPIIQSAVVSLNDPLVVKPSVCSTHTMLEKKYVCCKPIVKPDTNHNTQNAGIYTEQLAKKTLSTVAKCKDLLTDKKIVCYTGYNSFYRKVIPAITKPSKLAVTEGEYLRALAKKCGENDQVHMRANPQISIGCKE